MGKMKSISNIVIFYDNLKDVSDYLEEISNQTISNNIYVTIVMNKYSQLDAKKLELSASLYKFQLEILYPPENLGYLNGLLYGYRNSTFDLKHMDWIVFSNTDISFEKNSFFSDFMKKKYDEKIFCVAPSVYNPLTKSYSNPQYMLRHTKRSLERRIAIFSRPKLSAIYLKLSQYKGKINNQTKKDSRYVYSAHGCFFFLRTRFLNDLTRNYMSLLYSEEAFIAEEIRLRSGKIYYEDSIEVYHNESQVTGKLKMEERSRHIAESLKKVKEEYFQN